MRAIAFLLAVFALAGCVGDGSTQPTDPSPSTPLLAELSIQPGEAFLVQFHASENRTSVGLVQRFSYPGPQVASGVQSECGLLTQIDAPTEVLISHVNSHGGQVVADRGSLDFYAQARPLGDANGRTTVGHVYGQYEPLLIVAHAATAITSELDLTAVSGALEPMAKGRFICVTSPAQMLGGTFHVDAQGSQIAGTTLAYKAAEGLMLGMRLHGSVDASVALDGAEASITQDQGWHEYTWCSTTKPDFELKVTSLDSNLTSPFIIGLVDIQLPQGACSGELRHAAL